MKNFMSRFVKKIRKKSQLNFYSFIPMHAARPFVGCEKW